MRKRICKLIEKVLRNKKDVSFEDLDRLLSELGYERRQPGGGSSHYTYRKEGKKEIITIPYKKPVKEFYVKKVVELLHLEVLYEKEC